MHTFNCNYVVVHIAVKWCTFNCKLKTEGISIKIITTGFIIIRDQRYDVLCGKGFFASVLHVVQVSNRCYVKLAKYQHFLSLIF